jgi:hypothetical protein
MKDTPKKANSFYRLLPFRKSLVESLDEAVNDKADGRRDQAEADENNRVWRNLEHEPSCWMKIRYDMDFLQKDAAFVK